MRRLISLGLLLTLLLVPVPAAADTGHQRPKITAFEFLQPPLRAGINETLKVKAHDPDSWISEVQVRWEDANGDGGALFANTGCVQDPDLKDPGTPARLLLPVAFDKPGNYHVEVRAISEFHCQGENQKISTTLEKDVVVRELSQTFTDEDDALGAFDIASVEQTQESSDYSATTDVIHRLTMNEPWSNDQLAGEAFFEMGFDLDGDTSTIERILTVDLDEGEGSLRASMLDPNSGQGRGYAAVSRPDDETIEVRIPPLLLKKGLRSYRWYVYVDNGTQNCSPTDTCSDRAPDDGLIRHRL